jgi:solute carrier family 25 protein 39/40
MSVPGTVLYFATYEHARDYTAQRWPALRDHAPLLAGGGARLLTATVVSPVELMRTRMQAEQTLLQQGMLGGALKLVRRDGWLALFRGLAPSLWRDVPFSCIYWTGYEALKARALAANRRQGDGDLLDPTASFACGAISGGVAALVTNPFDVLKTRRQVADHARTAHAPRVISATASSEASMLRMLVQIARDEGVSALFAGLVPRLAKVAPSCAIMIASYEMGKGFFRSRTRERQLAAQGE